MPIPHVVDMYQGDDVTHFGAMKAAGVVGVIHKASQGAAARDHKHAARKAEAKSVGLLWGSYHFMTNADVASQVDNFLAAADPQVGDLVCIDFEPYNDLTPSLGQLKQWIALVEARLGRSVLIYSGNLIKEQMRTPDPYLTKHRLWLANYAATAHVPRGWATYWLWQFTGDGEGPGPHAIPGSATHGIDLSTYGGTDIDQLAAEWDGTYLMDGAGDGVTFRRATLVETAAVHPITTGTVVAGATGVAVTAQAANDALQQVAQASSDAQVALSPIMSLEHTLRTLSPVLLTALCLCAAGYALWRWLERHRYHLWRVLPEADPGQDEGQGEAIPAKAEAEAAPPPDPVPTPSLPTPAPTPAQAAVVATIAAAMGAAQ